jgi:hypothetical protein
MEPMKPCGSADDHPRHQWVDLGIAQLCPGIENERWVCTHEPSEVAAEGDDWTPCVFCDERLALRGPDPFDVAALQRLGWDQEFLASRQLVADAVDEIERLRALVAASA